MPALNELDLIERAIQGDLDALGRLLCTLDPPLRARVAPRIDSSYRAYIEVDDVLQVTYIEAFLQIGNFRNAGEGSLLAWLTRIASNNIVDAIRGLEADKRPPPTARISPESDESYDRLLSSLSQSGTTPSGHASRKEQCDTLDLALSSLPEDYETVIRSYYLEGRTARQIGRQLGRSAPAVHMLKSRGFERLGQLLSESKCFERSACG